MTTTAVIQAASQLTPSLVHSDSRQWSCVLDMQQQPGWVVALLHQRLKQHYPQLPKGYWAVQSWRQLSWQPLYLAVAAVHGAKAVPQLDRVLQRLEQRAVYHYQLGSGPILRGNLTERIEFAGLQLQQLSQSWFEAITSVGKLGRKTAQYLLADALCHCLSLLPEPPAQILAYSQDWLAALALEPAGGLTLTHIDGTEQLMVKRRSCCLHYLLEPRSLCANCPKNKLCASTGKSS